MGRYVLVEEWGRECRADDGQDGAKIGPERTDHIATAAIQRNRMVAPAVAGPDEVRWRRTQGKGDAAALAPADFITQPHYYQSHTSCFSHTNSAPSLPEG